MSSSDVIQIISITCTSILSIIAIVISILTLIQNNKIIFESNKPYISIFSKVINFTSPYPYLVIKNFGQSGATILDVKYDDSLNTYIERAPLKSMKNVFIAPNQSFIYSLDHKELDYDKTYDFKFTYRYLDKTYIEEQSVSYRQYKDICYTKIHASKDAKEISDVLQEMIIQNI